MRSSTGNQGGPLGPPPDRATYETLHAVLERRGDEGPTVDEALGMVTALVIGPGLTMPSIWTGWLLGEDPVLDTREEMASFTSAVFTIWNHIAGLDTPEGYRTLIESVETLPGDPRIERFCAGFARAVESDQESWNDQVVQEVIEATESRAGEDDGSADPAPSVSESDSPTVHLLMPILMLASRENPDRRVLGLELPEDWTDDLHTELLQALPSCLDALAYHLRQQRLIDAGIAAHEQPDGYPRPVRRSEPKVGRNDPCPCGSGKKFKRCCGR